MNSAVTAEVNSGCRDRKLRKCGRQQGRFAGERNDSSVVDGVRVEIENVRTNRFHCFDEAVHDVPPPAFGEVRNREQGHRGVTVGEMTEYGYTVQVAEGYDEAVMRTRLAVRAEGFSILTEMHVGGMLGPEAGTARQYLIMGAWNPSITKEYSDAQFRVAMQLPCNFVVQETGSAAMVAALDPADTLEAEDEDSVKAVDGARDALERVLVRVVGPA